MAVHGRSHVKKTENHIFDPVTCNLDHIACPRLYKGQSPYQFSSLYVKQFAVTVLRAHKQTHTEKNSSDSIITTPDVESNDYCVGSNILNSKLAYNQLILVNINFKAVKALGKGKGLKANQNDCCIRDENPFLQKKI